MGLGVGAAAVISRAIGQKDHSRVKRLTTDSLFLSVMIVTLLVVLGELTIDSLSRALGAACATVCAGLIASRWVSVVAARLTINTPDKCLLKLPGCVHPEVKSCLTKVLCKTTFGFFAKTALLSAFMINLSS